MPAVKRYACGMIVDWSHCKDVERIAGRVSGQWVVRGTRVLADSLIENADDGYTAEMLADPFDGLELAPTRRILDYARTHASHPV